MSYDERDWDPPDNEIQAEKWRRELRATVEDIQRDLGDRLKQEGMGWNRVQYQSWRKGALSALSSNLQDLRLLNDWIRNVSVG